MEMSGSFVSGQRLSKSLFKFSEIREFYLKVSQNYFITCFHILGKAIYFKNYLSHRLFLVIHGQSNHPIRSVKIAVLGYRQ